MIDFAIERENITNIEAKLLKFLISKEDMLIKSEELGKLGFETSLQKSRIIKKLRDKKIIEPLNDKGRIYTINFINNYLLRGIIDILKKQGFVSDFLNNSKI